MTIFNQDFRTSGSEIITDFDPGQDVIDFSSVNAGRGTEDFQRGAEGGRARSFNDGLIVDRQGDGVSLAEADGGTLISAGEGNSLFLPNVTPDQLSVSNITVDGQAIDISPDSDLQSILDVIAPTGGVNAEGGGGDDILTGSVGSDTLDGGAGDDVLRGGAGTDTLVGGEGDDVLDGGARSDVLTGGGGQDTFVQDFSKGGADTITDFNPNEDTIDFRGLTEGNLAVEAVDGGTLISAGEDNSLFVANVTPEQLGASNVTVDGQALAADTAVGRILSDVASDSSTVSGALEDEASTGGTSDDALASDDDQTTADNDAEDLVLKGGKGDDILEGGAGDDRLRGGKGDDTLEGGAGDDILKGGKGDDTFVQDFSKPGSDTITDFNPGQDTINFTGLNNLANISVEEADGGTLINAGPGNSLFVQGVALDQFSVDNITIDGQAASSGSGLGDFDLGSVLGDASSGSSGSDALDLALGKSLDASASQGGAVAESQTGIDALEQAGAVSEAAATEEAAAEEVVDAAAAG